MINFNHNLLIDLVKNKISNDQFAIRTIGVGATIDAINITEINGFGSQRPRYFESVSAKQRPGTGIARFGALCDCLRLVQA